MDPAANVTRIAVAGGVRPVRGVVFDMDGTLTRPYLDFAALRRMLGLATGDLLTWMEQLPPHEREAAQQVLDDFERDGVAQATWNDGARDALRRVRETRLPTALLTRNSREATREVMDKLGIEVDCVVTRDDGPVKPDPECLRLVARRLGVQVELLVMVGDYLHDTQTARAAGAVAVLLTNQQTPSWRVEADVVIETMDQLPGLLLR